MPRDYDPQPLAPNSTLTPLISHDERAEDYDGYTAIVIENRRLLNGKRISLFHVFVYTCINVYKKGEGEAFDAVPAEKRQIGLCHSLDPKCLKGSRNSHSNAFEV